MRITNNDINFKSKIKFVNELKFNNEALYKSGAKPVTYPWTIETMAKGHKVYTKGIIDCLCGGIIDGKDVALFHLATRNEKEATRDRVGKFDIKNIEEGLKKKIDLAKDNLHALIIGGVYFNDPDHGNTKELEELKGLFEKYKIPYSELTGRCCNYYYGEYSIFYNGDNDTWYITNDLTDSDYYYDDPFLGGREIEVGGKTVTARPSKEVMANRGIESDGNRRKTGVEEFFRGQFKDVKLCKFDKWA